MRESRIGRAWRQRGKGIVSRRHGLIVVLLLGCGRPAPRDGHVLDDVSRLNATRVREIVPIHSEQDVVAAVARARREGRKVSIAGRRHSQGKQAFAEDAVVLDMTGFRRVLAVDRTARQVRVESGASWDDVQHALNPVGLAVRVMQSSNIFTVGGSISSNIHGRDVDTGTILDTVVSMRVLLPSGEIREVGPENDPDILALVAGGYGLFGVILDATLSVTDNQVLRHEARLIPATEVPQVFASGRRPGQLFIARPSIAPGSFLEETIVETWTPAELPLTADLERLGEEQHVRRDRIVFDASRASAAGKEARWRLQKQLVARPGETQLVSRNNAMRPPTTPLEFLSHESETDTDIVQEYFVPDHEYGCFLGAARAILLAREVNLLGLTIRHVAASPGAFLSYAPEDSFAFMLYTNQGRDPAGRAAAERMTQELVDAAIRCHGRHYLTYQTWPTPEQVRIAYASFDRFLERKAALDPSELFQSGFYQRYRCRPE